MYNVCWVFPPFISISHVLVYFVIGYSQAIRNRGDGYPIVVSSTPKDTMALYSLRNPSEVNKFLFRLVRWRKNSSLDKKAKYRRGNGNGINYKGVVSEFRGWNPKGGLERCP